MMQTSQYGKSRNCEMKEDKYSESLAKNQVCAIIHMRDIGKNVLPKFVGLWMETPCWCTFKGHNYGRWKPTETSVFEFSYFFVNSLLKKLINGIKELVGWCLPVRSQLRIKLLIPRAHASLVCMGTFLA